MHIVAFSRKRDSAVPSRHGEDVYELEAVPAEQLQAILRNGIAGVASSPDDSRSARH